MKKFFASILVMMVPLALLAQTPVKGPGKLKYSTAPSVSASAETVESVPTLAEQSIAQYVYVGHLPCELGASVSVTADAHSVGYFDVQLKGHKFRMLPVETTTGAIRLEDRRVGAVWLQLANKSMLMNQKLGQRLADVCMSPEQVAVAEALIRNPVASLIDGPAPSAPK